MISNNHNRLMPSLMRPRTHARTEIWLDGFVQAGLSTKASTSWIGELWSAMSVAIAVREMFML